MPILLGGPIGSDLPGLGSFLRALNFSLICVILLEQDCLLIDWVHLSRPFCFVLVLLRQCCPSASPQAALVTVSVYSQRQIHLLLRWQRDIIINF